MKKIKQILGGLLDTLKSNNIFVIGSLRKKGEKGADKNI